MAANSQGAAGDPARIPPPAGEAGELDAANQSLAHALRWSFLLLTVIMVIVLGLWVLSGFRMIEPQQAGIRKVFGRVFGPVAGQGLTFTWPFPVGEIQIVSVKEQSLAIDEFWMMESPREQTLRLEDRRPRSEGLRPGWDGALFTGDRNLLHVGITCNYKVQDALAYLRRIDETDVAAQTTLREIIAFQVCKAAVHAAATRTANGISTTDKTAFADEVRVEAQRQLDLLTMDPARLAGFRGALEELPATTGAEGRKAVAAGAARVLALIDAGRTDWAKTEWTELASRIEDADLREVLGRQAAGLLTQPVKILRVSLDRTTWPLRALRAYNEAQEAVSRRRHLIDTSVSRARGILRAAAGNNYPKLVGEPFGATEAGTTKRRESGEVNLIGQYAAAVDAGDEARAAGLLERIDEVLMSNQTTGQAYVVLRQAQTRRTADLEPLKAWSRRFRDLLPQYRSDPEVLLTRLWAGAATEILAAPTNEKYMIVPGAVPTVIQLNRPPSIAKSVRSAALKADKKDKDSSPHAPHR